ncbi:MAG: hypothetical protein IPM24_24655 [Bryobacterales bacterium]|nr:hypothetical protein [Bryobacterales bacterium]
MERGGKRRRQRNAALIQKAIDAFAEKLESDEVRGSIGDIIRLMQWQEEMHEDRPDEIRVTWVEPSESEGAT